MKFSSTFLWPLLGLTTLLTTSTVLANPCGELIYNKYGKLRKYHYNNHTLSENIKEHGVFSGSTSSSSSTSTEGTTGALDPGVTTGEYYSVAGSTSTQGECRWFGLALNTPEGMNQYVAQNMPEIKVDMAKGNGGHLDVLANAYGCGDQDHEAFAKVLRQNFEKFAPFNAEKSKEFTATMDRVVHAELPTVCVAGRL